jgi:hypothetical protein
VLFRSLVDLCYAGDQVVEEPVQVACRPRVQGLLLVSATHVTSPLPLLVVLPHSDVVI